MKKGKFLCRLLVVAMLITVFLNVNQVYANVANSKAVSGYGTLYGNQEDLYEQPYNEICWVTMNSSLSGWQSGMRTAIDYKPVDTASGNSLAAKRTVSKYASSCSAVCYISDYGYYEDSGYVTLYSTHWVDGNGVAEMFTIYDIY